MVSLLDIGPATGTVKVRGKDIQIVGISADGVVTLLDRFPEFQVMLGGRNPVEITAQSVIAMIPAAISTIITMGCGGKADDAGFIAAAAVLTLEEQADMLEAIAKLTMPSGVGPFVERLKALGLVEGGVSGKGQVTKSPKPSTPA